MKIEILKRLKDLQAAIPSAPYGYSWGDEYICRKTERSYEYIARAPDGIAKTPEWEANASFIRELLEHASDLIEIAEKAHKLADAVFASKENKSNG